MRRIPPATDASNAGCKRACSSGCCTVSPRISNDEASHSTQQRDQDLRKLRHRYKRRWLVERLFAWLMRSRRLVTRYETKAELFLGFLRLACARLLWRRL
jgi:transposase